MKPIAAFLLGLAIGLCSMYYGSMSFASSNPQAFKNIFLPDESKIKADEEKVRALTQDMIDESKIKADEEKVRALTQDMIDEDVKSIRAFKAQCAKYQLTLRECGSISLDSNFRVDVHMTDTLRTLWIMDVYHEIP